MGFQHQWARRQVGSAKPRPTDKRALRYLSTVHLHWHILPAQYTTSYCVILFYLLHDIRQSDQIQKGHRRSNRLDLIPLSASTHPDTNPSFFFVTRNASNPATQNCDLRLSRLKHEQREELRNGVLKTCYMLSMPVWMCILHFCRSYRGQQVYWRAAYDVCSS